MTERAERDGESDLAIVLSGGGARAAYQVGLLRSLARHRPNLRFRIVTGVSSGAINAVYLGAHLGDLPETADELTSLWKKLTIPDIFRAAPLSLFRKVVGFGLQLTTGGSRFAPRLRGLVDTTPLRELLHRVFATRDGEIVGIEENLRAGRCKAVAVTTLDYFTGQTVSWVQGRGIENWERPHRKSVKARLSVEHVLASTSLPLFFPAVKLGDRWHGDGGIRLAAPLSPALHLGAGRILAVSNHYERSFEEAELPSVFGYPPPAAILGQMLDAVFLDILDQDILRLERLNAILRHLPEGTGCGLRPVRILGLRPSVDLGRLAAEFEPQLPRGFRFLTRSLGTRETKSPDFLSMVMFQPDYLSRLIEIGEKDADARFDEIADLVDGD